jgi:hypothetical protein
VNACYWLKSTVRIHWARHPEVNAGLEGQPLLSGQSRKEKGERVWFLRAYRKYITSTPPKEQEESAGLGIERKVSCQEGNGGHLCLVTSISLSAIGGGVDSRWYGYEQTREYLIAKSCRWKLALGPQASVWYMQCYGVSLSKD